MSCEAQRVMRALVCSAAVVVGTSGCLPRVDQGMKTYYRHLSDPRTEKSVFPYACLALRASTPAHSHLNCRFPCSRHAVWEVSLIARPDQPVHVAPYCPGYGIYPTFEVHEDSDSILFAPGFNPMGLDWPWWDADTYTSESGFWTVYHMVKRISWESGDLDGDYRLAVAALDPTKPFGAETFDCARHRAEHGLSPIDAEGRTPLIPLYTPSAIGGPDDITVNHSLLIFLLSLHDVWSDLQSRYAGKRDGEAIALICKSISLMVKAHDEKWPTHVWTARQEKLIAWCNSVAPDAKGYGLIETRRPSTTCSTQKARRGG